MIDSDLIAFVNQLRTLGVRTFKGQLGSEPIELELGPAVLPEAKDAAPEAPDCRCGHAAYEHGQGFCLRGCEPDECGDPKEDRS